MNTNDGRQFPKYFTLPKQSYMELKDGKKCGKMRLTPSNEKFGKQNADQYWVLGDIFLQNYYSIYDYPHNRMGLIEARQESLKDVSHI